MFKSAAFAFGVLFLSISVSGVARAESDFHKYLGELNVNEVKVKPLQEEERQLQVKLGTVSREIRKLKHLPVTALELKGIIESAKVSTKSPCQFSVQIDGEKVEISATIEKVEKGESSSTVTKKWSKATLALGDNGHVKGRPVEAELAYVVGGGAQGLRLSGSNYFTSGNSFTIDLDVRGEIVSAEIRNNSDTKFTCSDVTFY